ncbi:MAG: Gfo/Idh/MocA family oxidoreductase [Verrucomicrobiae bacterium]|nr:Gfo/Idh/MocA family oxidoreductase [Verrucomicrobiae bacterium]
MSKSLPSRSISRASSKPLAVAVFGAGGRGVHFGELLAKIPTQTRVAAVAEPRAAYREAFAKKHGLGEGAVFKDWREFLARPKSCDAVIVATMDREHVEPSVAALDQGYDLLLEKPMAVTIEDCRAIEAAQRRSKRAVAVCHSLRYHKAFATLKNLLDEGRIGKLVSLDQLEAVAFLHQAHSFVRGNWGREAESTFMLMAKSCHDVDYICHLVGAPCLRVSSFGSLSYFRPEHAPKGSTERCTDGCAVEETCPYSAIRHYVNGNREIWPATAVSPDHSHAAHLEAIRKGPYGRCVWRAGNDVVDHQVVAMEFKGGITATFTMTAFTQTGGRKIRLHGTEGEMEFFENRIVVRPFASGNTEEILVKEEEGGHGGGDDRVVRAWLRAIREKKAGLILTNAQESLRSHTVVFAAEKSRREGRTVELSELRG